jgi:histidine phosphotransferase ChpT
MPLKKCGISWVIERGFRIFSWAQPVDDVTLASLLVSRICHDLVAPAGAVNNGLELLRDELPDGADLASMDLLEFSANETLHRLLFFRLAFGAAGGLGVKIPVADAKTAAMRFFDGRKVGLDWPSQSLQDLPQPIIKLLLNMILLVAESMPRGGDVGVEISTEALKVTGAGVGAALAPDRQDALAGKTPEDQVNAQVIQAFYAGELARNTGISVNIEGDGTSFVTLGATLALS